MIDVHAYADSHPIIMIIDNFETQLEIDLFFKSMSMLSLLCILFAGLL